MSKFLKYTAEGLDAYLNLDLVQSIKRRKDDNRILCFSFGGPEPVYVYCDSISIADQMLEEIWGN